ncbi:MAG: hypothetical protein U0470_13305 [Anaerolineae bacterium]
MNAFPTTGRRSPRRSPERPGGKLFVRVWSWGVVLEGEVPAETWRANVYGAVVGRV